MGLESIVSQIPVVGSILGPLLGMILGGNNGARYTIRMGNSAKQEIDFTYNSADSKIQMINRTDNPVAVTFPAQNSYTGEMFVLPPISTANVTDTFVNCTTNDIDSFEITTSLSEMKNSNTDGGSHITISSSGIVPTDGNTRMLGSYIMAKVERVTNPQSKAVEGWVTIWLQPGQELLNVTSLYVESAEGNQEFNICNCVPEAGKVKVLLPPLCIKSPEVIMSVTAECMYKPAAKLMEEQNSKYAIRALTPEDIEKILAMPNVNQ